MSNEEKESIISKLNLEDLSRLIAKKADCYHCPFEHCLLPEGGGEDDVKNYCGNADYVREYLLGDWD